MAADTSSGSPGAGASASTVQRNVSRTPDQRVERVQLPILARHEAQRVEDRRDEQQDLGHEGHREADVAVSHDQGREPEADANRHGERKPEDDWREHHLRTGYLAGGDER